MLGGELTLLQAPICDGPSLDPCASPEDRRRPAEADPQESRYPYSRGHSGGCREPRQACRRHLLLSRRERHGQDNEQALPGSARACHSPGSRHLHSGPHEIRSAPAPSGSTISHTPQAPHEGEQEGRSGGGGECVGRPSHALKSPQQNPVTNCFRSTFSDKCHQGPSPRFRRAQVRKVTCSSSQLQFRMPACP